MGETTLMKLRRDREGGKMQLRSWIAWVTGVAVLAWSTVAVVQAQTVTSSDITDAVPSSSFDTVTSAPTPTEPPALNPVPAAQEPLVTLPDPAGLPTLPPVPVAQEPLATFSDIADAVPSRFFDAEATTPDPVNGNKLLIGFSTGFDAATWTVNEFTAST